MNCITNDEMSEIDAKLARKLDLPFALAEKLRAQLAANAAEAVRREKELADAVRERENWRRCCLTFSERSERNG